MKTNKKNSVSRCALTVMLFLVLAGGAKATGEELSKPYLLASGSTLDGAQTIYKAKKQVDQLNKANETLQGLGSKEESGKEATQEESTQQETSTQESATSGESSEQTASDKASEQPSTEKSVTQTVQDTAKDKATETVKKEAMKKVIGQ